MMQNKDMIDGNARDMEGIERKPTGE